VPIGFPLPFGVKELGKEIKVNVRWGWGGFLNSCGGRQASACAGAGQVVALVAARGRHAECVGTGRGMRVVTLDTHRLDPKVKPQA